MSQHNEVDATADMFCPIYSEQTLNPAYKKFKKNSFLQNQFVVSKC